MDLTRPLKPLSPSYRFTDEDGEYAVARVSFDLNRRERKAVRANLKSFVRELEDEALVAEPGCWCTSCQNDWDCCGNMVPRRAQVKFRKGGVVVEQHYVRNV